MRNIINYDSIAFWLPSYTWQATNRKAAALHSKLRLHNFIQTECEAMMMMMGWSKCDYNATVI